MAAWFRSALIAATGLFIAAEMLPTARACPFCPSSGATMLQDAQTASMILYGTPGNARFEAGNPNLGSTDLQIEVVIKKHAILGDKKVLTVPKYMPTEPEKPVKYLVFCDVYKGQIDPYRGMPFKPDSRIAEYLKGALALPDKDLGTRLKYFFNYLDDTDKDIAIDALMEFGNTDYKDYRPVAENLPAERVAGWLRDPSTPPSRFGLYGSMLGHCGKEKDAVLLREMIDDAEKRYQSGMDGLLAGYVLLKPPEGWAYLLKILKDEKREYLQRYAALRAVRFLWEFRPDAIPRDKLAEGLTVLLSQGDIADMAIEDLRKWKYWKAADQIIDLYNLKSHDIPMMKRAILRFALQCPASASAKSAKFLEEMRKKDPERVKEAEELLQMESAPPLPPASATSTSRRPL